jgi:hypothetical protein
MRYVIAAERHISILRKRIGSCNLEAVDGFFIGSKQIIARCGKLLVEFSEVWDEPEKQQPLYLMATDLSFLVQMPVIVDLRAN